MAEKEVKKVYDYFDLVCLAGQSIGKPHPSKRAIVEVLGRFEGNNSFHVDKEAVNRAWKRFKTIPHSKALGF